MRKRKKKVLDRGKEARRAARQSGIQVGDVIVAVDGHAVATASDLTDIINGHHPGDQVKVQWVRNGQRGSSTVSLGVGPAA